MPAEIWLPLVRALRSSYRMFVIDARGLPSLVSQVEQRQFGIEAHAKDVLAVAEAFRLPAAHVAGWCNGAVVAARAASLAPGRVCSLVWLNGAVTAADAPTTAFQEDMRSLMPKVAVNRKLAGALYRVVFGGKNSNRPGPLGWAGTLARKQASQIMGSLEPAYTHLTSLPRASIEHCYRYARMMTASFRDDPTEWIRSVHVPALVLTCTGDTTVHPGSTILAASMLPNAALVVLDDGDHMALYDRPQVAETVRAFLGSIDANASAASALAPQSPG